MTDIAGDDQPVHEAIGQKKLDSLAMRLSQESGHEWRCTNHVESEHDHLVGRCFVTDDPETRQLLSSEKVRDAITAIRPEMATIHIGQDGELFIQSRYLEDGRPVGRMMIALQPLFVALSPECNQAISSDVDPGLESGAAKAEPVKTNRMFAAGLGDDSPADKVDPFKTARDSTVRAFFSCKTNGSANKPTRVKTDRGFGSGLE